MGENNPLSQIDAEVEGLGDLADLHAQSLHAREVTTAAERDVADLIRECFPQLIEEKTPELEAATAEANAAYEIYRQRVNDLLNLHKQVCSWVAVTGGNTSHVPGLDQFAAIVRGEPVELPVPVPR